jgi:hypothetical protein
MTDARISEAKRSTATGPADSETRKKVFIACIHRPGFDACVPNILISEKIDVGRGCWRLFSEYNLQRNWPMLNIIGCFESERDARAALDVSFCAMKTQGVVGPRELLYKMRNRYWPFIALDDDCYDDSDDLNDEESNSGDERISDETARKLLESDQQYRPPTLWSIFPFNMHLTQWALSEVFVVSEQFNASCCCSGADEEIEIIGAFQGAAEARTVVEKKQEAVYRSYCNYLDEGKGDVPLSPKKFPSTLLIPDKDITENWHADGTGCFSFQVRDHQAHADCGIDRFSLRVQKVSNVTASKPIKLLAAVKSFLDTLVWLQLCNPQGIALFSFVRLPTPLRSPFAGARVSGILTRAERLSVVGSGFKGELVRFLSLGTGYQCEPQRKSGVISHKMMACIARRVAAKLFHARLAASVDSKSQSKKRARREQEEEEEEEVVHNSDEL